MVNKKESVEVDCPSCGKKNSEAAYCCVYCYKEMRLKDIPWWRRPIHLKWPITLALLVGVLFGIFKLKKLLERVEGQVTMNLSSDDFKVSVIADKKKSESDINIQSSVETSK